MANTLIFITTAITITIIDITSIIIIVPFPGIVLRPFYAKAKTLPLAEVTPAQGVKDQWKCHKQVFIILMIVA